jgi:hypothetical protein
MFISVEKFGEGRADAAAPDNEVSHAVWQVF